MLADVPASFSDAVHAIVASGPPPAFALGGGHPGFYAVAYPEARRIVWTTTPRVLVSAALSPRWTWRHELAVEVLIHEHLHLATRGLVHPVDRAIEEGVVSAVAADLLPVVTRARTGRPSVSWRRGRVHVYSECATRVRLASATGTRWRAPLARAWRARLLHAGPATRRAMLAAAGTAPAGLCPEAVWPG